MCAVSSGSPHRAVITDNAADQRDDLARADMQRQPVQRLDAAIGGGEIRDGEEGGFS